MKPPISADISTAVPVENRLVLRGIRVHLRPSAAASLGLFSLLLNIEMAGAEPSWKNLLRKSDDWHRSAEGTNIAENILSWQSDEGSWPKNVDTTASVFHGDRKRLKGTFDNGATADELRFLARAFRATGNERYRQAFLKGLDHILKAQYPTGGWPQYYPPGNKYPRHITFNDNAMTRLMTFLREVATQPDYEFAGAEKRRAARESFDSGIRCILKCQITANGKLTAWCAQHDEIDYSPRPARPYELVSISGMESVGILELLMSIEGPSPEIVRAVKAGVEWFETVRITGIRQDTVNGDKVIAKDSKAPPLWARFYEIESNRPFFCGRDGVKKCDISEIEAERRNGYAWHGSWGERLFKAYAVWPARQEREAATR